ncbi:10306_t:CDS:2 [Paraglomus brasilianum]|uniref:10306_t:CDS:1 n=1 Tax=Paraglomus brasilianum TaxID=144538 RepID=A0A9N9DRJ2_9GLOM|nr:10306_t:CDS:2 [Paraglomus brasilianum]
MPTIKVTHNDEIRQFAVSSHSTWTELSSTLRAIFVIPPPAEITLSYTDEDDDEVILSTDLELRELLNQHVPEGGPMKFTLRTAEENEEDGVVILNSIRDRNNSVGEKGWVLEGISGHEIVVNKDKLEDDVSSCDGEFENIDEDKKSVDIESRSENGKSDQEHTEERIPLLHGLSRAEVDTPSEEEQTESRETEIPPSSPQPPPSSPQPPPSSPQPEASNSNPTLDDLTQQLQSLVNQFQEFFIQNPQIVETANRLIHDVVDSVKGDVESFDETSQYAYTPTYTPPERSDDVPAYRECPFLSGMPGNTPSSQYTNNEERSPDQTKDEVPRQRSHPYNWNVNPSHRHHPSPTLPHPSHRHPGHPRPPHSHPPPPSPPSHFTSDSSDHPNLPSSFTAPPPPPPPPPVPQHTTQEQQETLPGTVPYINGIFRNLGSRLFTPSGINNDANDDTTDNMAYSPSHNLPRFCAYQSPDGDIKCGRGPFGEPKFNSSEYPGYSGDDQNVQDFALAPDDLLADIRLLREMGFTQPTRELECLFRRNNNNIDDVLGILLEETENRY